MINKWPIRCSTSLVTREIKTTERYHFPYTRTATVKKVNTSVDEDVKKSEPFYISSECKMVQLLIYTLCPLVGILFSFFFFPWREEPYILCNHWTYTLQVFSPSLSLAFYFCLQWSFPYRTHGEPCCQ